jgi:hypothetical protein
LISVVGCGFAAIDGRLQDFDRDFFYKVMADGKIEEINNELTIVGSAAVREKLAYEGALLMRKSGLLSAPAQKLKFFKEGRIKLETALSKDSANGEYHFLRLMIQEHAPQIVHYHDDLKADKQNITQSFSGLPPVVRQAILSYSSSSTVLHPQDF